MKTTQHRSRAVRAASERIASLLPPWRPRPLPWSPVWLAATLLLEAATPPLRAAAYSGSFNSATPQTPVTLGQGFSTAVSVKNTGLLKWTENAVAAWRTTVDSPSWSATWSSLNFYSVADVSANANAGLTVLLSAAQLPAAPGSYSVRFRTFYNQSAFFYEMSGSPKTVHFTIATDNHAPVLAAITDKTVVESNRLAFTITATDLESATQTLTFTLEAGAPAGASLDPTNGLFTWTPPAGHQPQSNRISVVVTDSGTPPLSATNAFTVVVLRPPRFLTMSRPTEGVARLFWLSHPGVTYRLYYKDSLLPGPWLPFPTETVATNFTASATNVLDGAGQRFYWLELRN